MGETAARNGSNGTAKGGAALRGWKSIAAYFGTDERTVKRWEAQRGLPIRRVPGGGRASVYADVGELVQWLAGQGSAPPAAAPPAPAAALRRRWWWALPAGVGALAVAALALTQGGGIAAPFAAPAPSRAAKDAYLAAAHQLEQRTPSSIARAIDGFGKAIAAEPAYADAHAGLAMAHLLAREHAAAPAEPAYARAAAAAERAVALDPRQAEGQAALGFATFYGRRDFARGLSTLERAVELDAGSGRTLHWYATALYHAGDLRQALTMIERAQRRSPGTPAIVADKALILHALGRRSEALALLDQIAAERPELAAPHRYVALIALAEGDHAAWLAASARAADLAGDKALAADVAAARAAGPGDAMLAALLERRRAARPRSHYDEAVLLALAGQRDAAFAALDRAFAAKESLVTAIRIDPRLARLRGDARFAEHARRAGGG
jgi:tetratricopeptide (TPR) repeat protein